MSQLSRSSALLLLFGIGVLIGIWEVVSPWVVGYGNSGLHGAAGSSVWSGAAVVVSSLVALVVLSAAAIRRDTQSVITAVRGHADGATADES